MLPLHNQQHPRCEKEGTMLTPQELKAVIGMIHAVGDCIRELKQVPSGELYARLCGKLTLDTYNQIISALVGAKMVKNDNHLLIWIGPSC